MNLWFGLLFSSAAFSAPDEIVFGILRDGDSSLEQVRVENYSKGLAELQTYLGASVGVRIPIEYMQPPRVLEGETLQVVQQKKLEESSWLNCMRIIRCRASVRSL